jgi:hypothetical protein
MSALFPPAWNTIVRVAALGLLAAPVIAVGALYVYAFSPLYTGQRDQIEQVIQFDHRHHVTDDGIDCRYCHSSVERSPYAGIPPTETCMNCHAQVWNKSPLLDEVRARYFTDRAIPWNRVHRLPNFVYFNHSIHVNKGVGCVTCHGRVDRMALVEQMAPLTMSWCLDCHRDPAKHLRPVDLITDMTWEPDVNRDQFGRELMTKYDVHTRTSCTTCHR